MGACRPRGSRSGRLPSDQPLFRAATTAFLPISSAMTATPWPTFAERHVDSLRAVHDDSAIPALVDVDVQVEAQPVSCLRVSDPAQSREDYLLLRGGLHL